MTASTSLLGEAELHGLVDGHLEVDRRADVLRRLAASPADRALIEAWQEQNDLIRASFQTVEREALPVALDLAPPRLRCIEGDLDRPLAPIHALPARSPRRALATAAAILVVAIGLAGSWVLSNQGRDDDPAASAGPQAPLEGTLAERAANALDDPGSTMATSGAALPSIRIPDLSSSGLRLISVSTQPTAPPSMVLRYRDAGDGRVVLGIAGAPDATPMSPTSIGKSFAWRRDGAAYALAGTLPRERLRVLVQSLQDETGK